MWRFGEYRWPIAITTAIVSGLWIWGPLAWIARENPDLTAADFQAWVLAGWEYRYLSLLAFLPLITLVCLELCKRYWPRIWARQNLVVNQLYKQLKAREADLSAREKEHDKRFNDFLNDFVCWEKALKRRAVDLEDRSQAQEILSKGLRTREAEIQDILRDIQEKEQKLVAQEQAIVQKEEAVAEDKREAEIFLAQARKEIADAKQQAKAILDKAELGARSLLSWAEEKKAQTQDEDSQHERKCRLVLEFLNRRNGQVRRPDLLASRILEGGSPEYDLVLESLINQGLLVCEHAYEKKNDWKYTLITVA